MKNNLIYPILYKYKNKALEFFTFKSNLKKIYFWPKSSISTEFRVLLNKKVKRYAR